MEQQPVPVNERVARLEGWKSDHENRHDRDDERTRDMETKMDRILWGVIGLLGTTVGSLLILLWQAFGGG